MSEHAVHVFLSIYGHIEKRCFFCHATMSAVQLPGYWEPTVSVSCSTCNVTACYECSRTHMQTFTQTSLAEIWDMDTEAVNCMLSQARANCHIPIITSGIYCSLCREGMGRVARSLKCRENCFCSDCSSLREQKPEASTSVALPSPGHASGCVSPVDEFMTMQSKGVREVEVGEIPRKRKGKAKALATKHEPAPKKSKKDNKRSTSRS